MKNIALTFVLIITFFSCKKELKTNDKSIEVVSEDIFTVDTDNAKNVLDWEGSYVGILPCKDCEGSNTEIILNLDHTFVKSTSFIKSDKEEIIEKGKFLWLEDGCTIILNDTNRSKIKVTLNTLTFLSKKGKKISNNPEQYVLHKNTCEENDFEEFSYVDKDGKKYLVIFGHSCDGLFAEIKSDTLTTQLLRETASENATVYGNNENIKLIDKKDHLILQLDYKEIILTLTN